jgi:hypothetical protein
MLLLSTALYPLKLEVFVESSWQRCKGETLERLVKDSCLHLGLQRKCKVGLHRVQGECDGFFRDTVVLDCVRISVSYQ